jgi:GR25 family glycosyltransferase involved in LPS biosynthesis
LSHRALCQRYVAEHQPFIVCEDDAVLRGDFAVMFPELLKRIPKDWDFVLLGYNVDSATSLELFPGVVMHSWFSKQLLEERDLAAFLDGKTEPTVLPLHHGFGTCAYAVSPTGARHLLERCFPLTNRSSYIPSLRRSVISFGIDSLMNTFSRELRAFCQG